MSVIIFVSGFESKISLTLEKFTNTNTNNYINVRSKADK